MTRTGIAFSIIAIGAIATWLVHPLHHPEPGHAAEAGEVVAKILNNAAPMVTTTGEGQAALIDNVAKRAAPLHGPSVSAPYLTTPLLCRGRGGEQWIWHCGDKMRKCQRRCVTASYKEGRS